MRCGWCKMDGVDREHVKKCSTEHYNIGTVQHTAVKAFADEADREAQEQRDEELAAANALDEMAGAEKANIDPPSDSQVEYAIDLLAGHEWPDVIDESDLRGMARRQVSKLITAVQTAPLKRREFAVDIADHIPAGRYAIAWSEGDVMFYQVDKPTEGKWAGSVFVKLLIGAPGNYNMSRVRGMNEARILTRIGEDPKAAMVLYGRESKECGRCHSPLTVKASRDRGLGPKCATKSGWF